MKKLLTLLLLVVLTIIMAGCGQSNVSQTSKSQEESTQVVNDTRKFNLEKYMMIKVGSTYDEVKVILGDPGKALVDNARMKQYQWTNEDNSVISVTFYDNKVTARTQTRLGPQLSGKKAVTLNKFDQIKDGMTLKEATDILGQGTERMLITKDGKEEVTLCWENTDGSEMSVTFTDEKVKDKKKLMLK